MEREANLQKTSFIPVKTVEKEALVKRESVKLDLNGTPQERTIDFKEKMGNPNLYLRRKCFMMLSYTDTDKTIEDSVERILTGV